MSSLKRPYHRLAGAFLATAVLLFATAGSDSPRADAASSQPASPSELQQRIGAGQNRISSLSGVVSAGNAKVNRLGSSISNLQGQIDHIQGDLNASRDKLLKLRDEQAAAQARLSQLQTQERQAQSALSQQLVGTYEGDNPDLVSVVLESTGFNNLLERVAFAQRIGHQDAQVVSQVRSTRKAVAAQATALGAMSVHQQQLTLKVLNERNRLGRAKLDLVNQQLAASKARNASASQLASARRQVSSLRNQLAKIEAASAPGSGGSSIVPNAKGFVFPIPKADVSPPATWSLDDGVDMAAPGGAPELAVCSGTVVLHGIGGFGPSAPVLHCDSPLGGYGYVYYGHAGPGHWVNTGTHVSAGQVISEVGSGIVGISTGPHIEIGFADSSGSPIGPSSASQMAALLHSSY
jgi:murein DD-endopeptidase MepM/ murein hydrolase activator NlpD